MSTTANEGFELVIKTNSYTGNFEREMCAYLTGQYGECEVGKEFINLLPNKPDFESIINQVADDHGCYRPVSLHEQNPNNLVIFFHKKPSEKHIDHIKQYASTFDHVWRTYGRMAEFRKNNPKIEILGFAIETYKKEVTEETV